MGLDYVCTHADSQTAGKQTANQADQTDQPDQPYLVHVCFDPLC